MVTTKTALIYTFAMAGVIFLCRALPFLIFRGRDRRPSPGLSRYIERTVPQAAMTVLACNALAGPLGKSFAAGSPASSLPVLLAAFFTAVIHLWKRNPLLSIFGGTALYLVLSRVI